MQQGLFLTSLQGPWGSSICGTGISFLGNKFCEPPGGKTNDYQVFSGLILNLLLYQRVIFPNMLFPYGILMKFNFTKDLFCQND